MHEVAARTAAVFVVYHLSSDIEPSLATLLATVGQVLVVDNHERGHAEVAAIAKRLGIAHLHSGNVGGLAGAYNRALEWLNERHPQMRHVVFLDDDSEPAALAALLADGAVTAALAATATAAVSPAYRDRATAMRGRYIRLGHFSLTFNPREFSDLRAVAFLINSMAVWRVQALQQIGPFNQMLAVDHIDTEYCLRARQLGLSLFVAGAFEFAHSIGQRKKYRLFGRELQAGGHAPERRFMIARNTVWLARTWLWREPAFAALCLARLGYEMAGIVLAEDRVFAKLAALAHGAACGLVLRSPPLSPPPSRSNPA